MADHTGHAAIGPGAARCVRRGAGVDTDVGLVARQNAPTGNRGFESLDPAPRSLC